MMIEKKDRALKIMIVPDKFKGTLTAAEAAFAIKKGWRAARPKDVIKCIPMSDGGDGFGEAIALQTHGKQSHKKTFNAAGKVIDAAWWWLPKSRTALIESAQVVGLAQLPKGQFHPFELDSFGLGLLLKYVFEKDPQSCLIGLGGSATNDGGFGMARALGWSFLDDHNEQIKDWTHLTKLNSIKPPDDMKLPDIIVAADVKNPLLGTYGASRIYGPQKGLQLDEIPTAEKCLETLSHKLDLLLGKAFSSSPGAGAAGGLGYGCLAFLNGKMKSGFDVFSQKANIKKSISDADLVITGEGFIDRSSLMGKGVGCIAEWCKKHRKPCIGLGGKVDTSYQFKNVFTQVYSIIQNVGYEDAFTKPDQCLLQLAKLAASHLRNEDLTI